MAFAPRRPHWADNTLFDDMAVGDSCLALTGFPSATLAYMWNTWGATTLTPSTRLPHFFRCRRGERYSMTLIHFYLLYVFIHMYPQQNQMKLILRVNGMKTGIGKTTCRTKIVPMAIALAASMDEVKWADRLDPRNHHAFFPVGFTTVWDTVPIYVATPTNSRMNRYLYQPKYKNCVMKVQVAVSFLLQIVYYSCLHIGTAHDGSIYTNTLDQHPFETWEWGLGDMIYQTAHHLLLKHRKPTRRRNQPPPPPLTSAQLAANDRLDFARSGVERVFANLTNHKAFQSRPGFRGTLASLTAYVHVIVQTTAAMYRHHKSRHGRGLGPYPHDWRDDDDRTVDLTGP